MPWEGVTVSEQKQRFIEDYLLNCYSKTELAERFSVSRTPSRRPFGKTAHKSINRYRGRGQAGLEERSRRPKSCPWQTPSAIVEELVELRKAHPSWGPKKLLDVMERREPERKLPGDLDGGRDPGRRRAGEASAPDPMGSPGLPADGGSRAE